MGSRLYHLYHHLYSMVYTTINFITIINRQPLCACRQKLRQSRWPLTCPDYPPPHRPRWRQPTTVVMSSPCSLMWTTMSRGMTRPQRSGATAGGLWDCWKSIVTSRRLPLPGNGSCQTKTASDVSPDSVVRCVSFTKRRCAGNSSEHKPHPILPDEYNPGREKRN